MKHMKDLIMSNENTAKKVKSSQEAMEVIKEMEKNIRSNKYSIL